MIRKDVEPAGYAATLAHLKAQVRAAQTQAKRAANASLLGLYWTIGSEILSQQQQQGWGAKVIDRLARDLRAEFPEMRGLNRSNLYAMRAFALAWPDRAIVPTALGQLSWAHVRCLLDRFNDPVDRTWYAAEATDHGWTLAVLEHQIATNLRRRIAAAPSNFAAQLPTESDRPGGETVGSTVLQLHSDIPHRQDHPGRDPSRWPELEPERRPRSDIPGLGRRLRRAAVDTDVRVHRRERRAGTPYVGADLHRRLSDDRRCNRRRQERDGRRLPIPGCGRTGDVNRALQWVP